MTRFLHPMGTPRAARRPITRRLRAAALAGLAVGAGACTDVTTAPRSAVSSENVFNDAGAYQAAVAKLYGTLALAGPGDADAGSSDIQGIDSGFGQYLRAYWNLQELPTDEATLAWNDQSAGVQDLNSQTWTPGNGTLTAMYARILLQATLASEFLRQTTDERLAARNVTTAQRTEIARFRAEARFLRALSYWHAIDLFGSVPFVTEGSPVGGSAPAQATRQQLFDYAVNELQAIRADLPAGTPGPGQYYGRATQAAADMLLAKLYLNAQVYTGTARNNEAVAAAARVIGNGAYQLDPSYQHLTLADNHTSPELVFTVPQDGARTQTFGGTTFLMHAAYGPDIINDLAGGVKDTVVHATRDFGMNGGWYGLRARPEFAGLFDGLTGDKRGFDQTSRQSIVFRVGQTPAIANRGEFTQGYRIHKYRNVNSNGVGGTSLDFSDIDYPMFRLADAYLMYAEGVLRGGTGGDRGTALGYVNAIRQRAGAPTISDGELTLDFILDERARELFWEGHRRTDLIRFGKFSGADKIWQWKGGQQAGTGTQPFRNLYPLPAAELVANPSLRQNPGYTN